MKNTNYPAVKLKQGCARRAKAGSPWVFSNEIDMTAETKNIPAGTLTRLYDANDTFIGVGSFNPHSLISFRKMASDPQTEINTAFFAKRLRRCVDLRNALVNSPFYRLVHSEGDGLPGLIIDRFDDIVACQLNTAGTDALKQEIVDALERMNVNI
ncbi:MAG: RlmI/RlmK family 23S rRNA methyltransferase, partial [Alphaproteobacteria bacterium]